MSFYIPSKYQDYWFKSVHLTILKEKIEVDEVAYAELPLQQRDPRDEIRLKWRRAYNTFQAGLYFDADKLLEKVCVIDLPSGNQLLNRNYRAHLTGGRCSVQLFLLTNSHYHLENAYRHYDNAIHSLKLDLSAMFILPKILFEFGRLLEFYGSFSASLELYSRILTNFPFWRGYFDTMYRSAIVSKHLAESVSVHSEKEELVNKTIDVLQFLLEAVPSTIHDLHIVLLYARTLEIASKPVVRYRSRGAFQALYDFCRSRKICNADSIDDYRDWQELPEAWLEMGIIASNQREPLIAKEAFECYVNAMDLMRGASQPLHSLIKSSEASMIIAKTYASFQNFDKAVEFGGYALQIDRFNKEARHWMSKWSTIYQDILNKEVSAVHAIEMIWKGRCWTNGFRKRLKNLLVVDMESRLKDDRFDGFARKQLAYFARNQYRSQFLFEEACATRIQRQFRSKRKMWVWQAVQRNAQLQKASDVYRLYTRRPFDSAVRDNVKAITDHRLCPRKHAIRKVRQIIDRQDNAMVTIMKCYRLFLMNKRIGDIIEQNKSNYQIILDRAATKIQSVYKIRTARMILRRKQEEKLARLAAAIVIQRFIRWRGKQFRHIAALVHSNYKRRRKAAEETLRYSIRYRYSKYKQRKLFMELLSDLERQKLVGKEQLKDREKYRLACVIKLQAFFRRAMQSKIAKIVTSMFQARRDHHDSILGDALLCSLLTDDSCRYKSPGVRQNTTQFIACLQQMTVYCPENFIAADCMMLANVLRHMYCGIQRLCLHGVTDGCSPSFEFDLIPAVNKCRSLRSLYLIGGKYSERFMQELFNSVQAENPRISELCIENLSNAGQLADAIGASCGRLLMDYFNYSLPGIQILSLHGCRLSDDHVTLIAQGMEVNSSIKELVLSSNLFTDEGFLVIFQSLSRNKKVNLRVLNFQCNFISCKRRVREALDAYVNPNPNKRDAILEVNLLYNMMSERYEPPVPYGGRSQFIVKCNCNLPVRNLQDISRNGTPAVSSAIPRKLLSSRSSSKSPSRASSSESNKDLKLGGRSILEGSNITADVKFDFDRLRQRRNLKPGKSSVRI